MQCLALQSLDLPCSLNLDRSEIAEIADCVQALPPTVFRTSSGKLLPREHIGDPSISCFFFSST